jgi:uncharacterized protein
MTTSHLVVSPLRVNGTMTAHLVWRAMTWRARARGLLGTSTLEEPCGLWLAPCSAVHMIGMRYSIDVVFMRQDGTVLKVVSALKPWSAALCLRAQAVLELRTGMAASLALRPGMRLALGAVNGPARSGSRTSPS